MKLQPAAVLGECGLEQGMTLQLSLKHHNVKNAEVLVHLLVTIVHLLVMNAEAAVKRVYQIGKKTIEDGHGIGGKCMMATSNMHDGY